MRFFFIALLIGAAAATPAKTRKTSPRNCSQISQGCAPKVSTFCSSYNKVTPTTTTATVSSGVATSTSTFIAGTTTTTITVSTCTAQSSKNKLLKRAATGVPACLRATGPAQISSACSCLATTNTVTKTTTVATSTTTLTSTAMITATYTSLTPPPCPTVTELGSAYHNYADACGVVENGSNPGGNQVFVSHYPGNLGACAAISSCASAAASKTASLGPLSTNAANSFDIHLLTSNQWECIAYQKTSNDPSYFNVQNGDVLAAYGYTI